MSFLTHLVQRGLGNEDIISPKWVSMYDPQGIGTSNSLWDSNIPNDLVSSSKADISSPNQEFQENINFQTTNFNNIQNESSSSKRIDLSRSTRVLRSKSIDTQRDMPELRVSNESASSNLLQEKSFKRVSHQASSSLSPNINLNDRYASDINTNLKNASSKDRHATRLSDVSSIRKNGSTIRPNNDNKKAIKSINSAKVPTGNSSKLPTSNFAKVPTSSSSKLPSSNSAKVPTNSVGTNDLADKPVTKSIKSAYKPLKADNTFFKRSKPETGMLTHKGNADTIGPTVIQKKSEGSTVTDSKIGSRNALGSAFKLRQLENNESIFNKSTQDISKYTSKTNSEISAKNFKSTSSQSSLRPGFDTGSKTNSLQSNKIIHKSTSKAPLKSSEQIDREQIRTTPKSPTRDRNGSLEPKLESTINTVNVDQRTIINQNSVPTLAPKGISNRDIQNDDNFKDKRRTDSNGPILSRNDMKLLKAMVHENSRSSTFGMQREPQRKTVKVSIGRIEVRAIPPPQQNVPQKKVEPRRGPRMSLDSYLKNRREGKL